MKKSLMIIALCGAFGSQAFGHVYEFVNGTDQTIKVRPTGIAYVPGNLFDKDENNPVLKPGEAYLAKFLDHRIGFCIENIQIAVQGKDGKFSVYKNVEIRPVKDEAFQAAITEAKTSISAVGDVAAAAAAAAAGAPGAGGGAGASIGGIIAGIGELVNISMCRDRLFTLIDEGNKYVWMTPATTPPLPTVAVDK